MILWFSCAGVALGGVWLKNLAITAQEAAARSEAAQRHAYQKFPLSLLYHAPGNHTVVF